MLYFKGLILCVGDPIVVEPGSHSKVRGTHGIGKSLYGLSDEEFTLEEDGHDAGVNQ